MSNRIWEIIRIWGLIGAAIVFLLILHLTMKGIVQNRNEIIQTRTETLQNRQETLLNRELNKKMQLTIDTLRLEIKQLKK